MGLTPRIDDLYFVSDLDAPSRPFPAQALPLDTRSWPDLFQVAFGYWRALSHDLKTNFIPFSHMTPNGLSAFKDHCMMVSFASSLPANITEDVEADFSTNTDTSIVHTNITNAQKRFAGTDFQTVNAVDLSADNLFQFGPNEQDGRTPAFIAFNDVLQQSLSFLADHGAPFSLSLSAPDGHSTPNDQAVQWLLLPLSQSGHQIDLALVIALAGPLPIPAPMSTPGHIVGSALGPESPENTESPKEEPEEKEPEEEKEQAKEKIDLLPTAPTLDYDPIAPATVLAQARDHMNGLSPAAARARDSLYVSLSYAYSLYFSAQHNEGAYQALLKEQGLKAQKRAPFTPILKMIFGHDYDKTRITEYATALSFCLRQQQKPNQFLPFIENINGGIKGCVKQERNARQMIKLGGTYTPDSFRSTSLEKKLGGNGKIPTNQAINHSYDILRHVQAHPLDTLTSAAEFTLLLARKNSDGQLETIGSYEAQTAVLETAIIHMAGQLAGEKT